MCPSILPSAILICGPNLHTPPDDRVLSMDTPQCSVVVHRPSLEDSSHEEDSGPSQSFLVHLPSYKQQSSKPSSKSNSKRKKKKQQRRHDEEIARKKLKLESVYGSCKKCPDPGVFRGYCAAHSDLTCFLSFCDLKAYHPKTELCRAHWESKSVLGKCLVIDCTNDGSCEGYCFDHMKEEEEEGLTEDLPEARSESPKPRKTLSRENWTSFENYLAAKERTTPQERGVRERGKRGRAREDCSVSACSRPERFDGLCQTHHNRTCFRSECENKAHFVKSELCQKCQRKPFTGKCTLDHCRDVATDSGLCETHRRGLSEDSEEEEEEEQDISKCFISSCRNQMYHEGSQLCRKHYQDGKHANIGKCLAKKCHERGELEGYCLSHVDTLFRAMSSSPGRAARTTSPRGTEAKHKRLRSPVVLSNKPPQRSASTLEGVGSCPVMGCTDMGTFRGYCMLHSTLECFVPNCHRLAQSSDTELCRRHKHNSVGKCKMFGCFQPGDVEKYCSEHVISIFPSEEVKAHVASSTSSSSVSKGDATSEPEGLPQPKATVEPPESRRIPKRTDTIPSCYYPNCSVLGSIQGYCVEHSLLECFVSSCFLKAENPTTELCRKHHLLKCHTNRIRGKCSTPYVTFGNRK